MVVAGWIEVVFEPGAELAVELPGVVVGTVLAGSELFVVPQPLRREIIRNDASARSLLRISSENHSGLRSPF